ncbi:aminotransferase class I/II-fold pyridoxal phosphate-dependent enzyme [Metallumcola ferriviriculae]|uniref:Aminotransferase n=1 Tax=Metallumcola ferriviriculae TaxID=3039180 RepID=A0AAU0UQJ8_9FIRM|nr:aminotransferase class I/II-fold pyridoxal phosphate-dependent enzyme [Desulfitibacteraceae bacterium MK1]
MTFQAGDFVVQRLKELPPSGIRKFFDLVANTKGVISLGVGEPDFVTPWHVREACVYSLEKGYTMYTSNFGTPELRKGIVRYLAERYQLEYSPDNQVLVTVGASEAVDLALRSVINSGDQVIIPEPCYVSYKPCAVMAGGEAVSIATKAENDFKLTAEQLRQVITPRSKVLILCYPNNPTGAVMTREELSEIAKVVEENNLLVIADEIYSELSYSGEHTSFPSLPGMKDRTILINGFSKSFAMTGWRVGFAAGHRDIIAAMVKIHQYTILCAPVTAQMAALEALNNGMGQVEYMVEQYNQRRRLILKRLRDMGLECFEPRGAFYAFPSIKNTGLNEDDFCEELLKEESVAVVPGSAFGRGGEGHIRISYASSIQQIEEAMDRMERFVARRIG